MATNLEVTNDAPAMSAFVRMGAFAPQLGLLFSLAAGLTLAAGVLMWAMRPSFVPLDLTMSERDSVDVIAMLQSNKTRYELDPSSGRILVPSDKLAEVRMQLLGAGLSGNTTMGSEMLHEDQSIGTSTQLLNERFRLVRETELSRTIASLRGVDAARVHLALPKQTSFVRNRSRASASVMLKLSPGRSLDAAQVQGIVNLVASSVPNMDIAQVTVVDQYSRLLSRDAAGGEMAISNRQFEYKRTFERSYATRIEELLAPIIGVNGVRAQVNAELDFSENERHEEAFVDNPSHVRSEQIEAMSGDGAGVVGGVPGALTNQPPAGGTVGAADDQGGAAPATDKTPIARSTMRNYELDKTVTRTRVAPGRVLRLSVAVLVDDQIVLDDKGKATRTARAQDEIDSITGLVKEAIGFNAERGDSVVILNRSFETPAPIEAIPEPQLWEQSWFDSMVKNALAALVMGLLLILVLRPAVSALTRKVDAANETPGADVDDETGLPMLSSDRVSLSGSAGEPLPPPPRVYGDILNLAREMANEDPKRVAMVLRKWVDGDE